MSQGNHQNGNGINDLPPDSVSTQQLLMMVRDLRVDLRNQKQAECEWRKEITEDIKVVAKEVKNLSAAFEQGKTTIRIMKWLAAIATGAIALYEAIRRIGLN